MIILGIFFYGWSEVQNLLIDKAEFYTLKEIIINSWRLSVGTSKSNFSSILLLLVLLVMLES